jgi:general secretion pathway protein D
MFRSAKPAAAVRLRSEVAPGGPAPRLTGMLCTVVLAATLAGCAATQTFREGNALIDQGNAEQGLAKIEDAVKLDPRNAEFRIALASRRATIVNGLIAAGEAARRDGRLTDAEKAYRRVLGLDPNQPMARQGLEALVSERRQRQMVEEAESLFKKGHDADFVEALERLRPVLSEAPDRKDALNLKARINEARAKSQKSESKLAAAYQKPITLEFRDAPLKSVFDVISKVSGLNFFYDKDIRPDLKVTVLVKNTSIDDAIRLILVTNQLEQRILGANTVLVYPSTPQKLKDYQTLSVRSFYLTNADVKAVSNSIKTIVKTKDMVIDERLGIIIMRDTPEAIRMAERIVALQDLTDPEVMLEVEVMEIKRARLMELGIQWPSQLTLSPIPGSGTSTTLSDLRNLSASTIQATIGSAIVNARKEDQDANILANPRIRVRNKEKAKVLIGDRVPVITTTSTSTGFVSESVNYVDVGLKLEVEPNIYLDEEVAIKVNLEVSSLVREVLSKSGTLSYQIGTRGANTVLRLKDGETQILAGLISDEDRSNSAKIPGLGQLPVMGRLFGSQKDDSQRSEILLSITPRIVRSIRRPDLMAAEFESGTESSMGAQSLHLESSDAGASSKPPAASAPGSAPPAASGSIPPAASPTSPTVAPAAATAAPAAAKSAVPSAAAPSGAGVSLAWQGPAQIKVGEQFSVSVRVNSAGPVKALPVSIGFDPQLMQIASVNEGDFLKQGNAKTSFTHRIDAAQGKVFVAAVRQGASGADPGINGSGSLATLTFKALKATAAAMPAQLRLLSASPDPASDLPVGLPQAHPLKIVP